MVIRVIGVPDHNGVITVSCGADTLEIQVAGAKPGGSVDEALPTFNPFDKPFAAIVAGLPGTSGQIQGASIHELRTGPARIVERVLADIADEATAGPSAVVIKTANAGLHDLHALGRSLEAEAPHLPIVLDYRPPSDR